MAPAIRLAPSFRGALASAALTLMLCAPGQSQDAPSPCSASDDRLGPVLITWEPVAGAFHYRVYRDGELIAFISPPNISYSDDTSPGPHEYCITAFTAQGEGPSCCDSGVMTPVAAPAQLTATDHLTTGIELTWTPVSNVQSYLVYRGASLIATVPHPTASYVDAPVPGTYTYCVRAQQGGTLSSPRCDSGTLIPLAAPAACEASDTSNVHVVVTWAEVAGAESYEVFRSNVSIATVPQGVTTFTDVPPVGAYEYCVWPRNQAQAGTLCCDPGERVPGPPPPPLSPAPCFAEQWETTKLRLSWPNVANEEGYRVHRDGELLATLPADVTSYVDANPGAEVHSYCIVAYRADLVSPPCCVEGVALATPGPCTATSDAPSITFVWPDVEHETSYRVYRDGHRLQDLAANVTSFVDVPGTGSHVYCVRAFYGAIFSDDCCATGRIRPAAPASCSATPLPTAVRVAWGDVAHEEGYRVLRDGVEIGAVGANVLQFDDTAAGPGMHEYCVVAFNGPVTSDPCCTQGGLVPPPAFCQASDDDLTRVVFGWDDVEGEDGYRVLRDGQVLADLPAGTVEYVDVPNPGRYHYCVRAERDGFFSADCCDHGERPFDPSQPPPTPESCSATSVASGSLRISWIDVVTEDGYRVYRDGAPLATLPANATFYDDPAPGSVLHEYCVEAFRGPVASARCCVTAGWLAAPLSCAATDNDTLRVTFSWTDIENEDGYRVTRDGQPVGELPANITSFVDQPSAGAHQYCVRAFRAGDTSAECCDYGTQRPLPSTASLRLSWNACTVHVPNQQFIGPGVYRLVASGTGFSAPMIGFDLSLALYPSVQDAWRFDDGGCQGGSQLLIQTTPFSKTCPILLGPNSFRIVFYAYDPGMQQAQLRFVETFDPFVPSPATRYTLVTFAFDHSFSVTGPTTPGATCGGAEHGMLIEARNAEGLLLSGDKIGLGGTETWVTWNGGGAVKVTPTTLGRIKALYR